jgi:putative ABC transport system permease protein
MKDVVVDIYYHSYSLPTYETIWNTEAFWLTTVVPCLIVFAIVLLILVSMMHLPPLQFLRHELRKKKKKGVIRLPEFKFFTRFRLRIVFQNISAYLTLFLGVFFASFLLFFGMMMSPLLQNFKTEVINSEIAKYQYILKAPVQTETKGAEKYAVMSLQTERGEEITVYGVEEDSTYLKDAKIPSGKNKVLLSDGFLEKYGLKEGGKVTLEKKYEDDSYTFTASGTYDYPATLSVFMSMENFNRIFDYDENYFNGYFTDKKIKDIDSSMVASIITQDDLTVIADQLEDSMGDMMWLMCAFSVFLYVLVIYLLAKMIVEKNEQSISMIKILGYSDKEAGSLYNRATGAVLVISLLLVIPICHFTMMVIYYVMMQQFNGWLTYYVAPWVYPAMIAIGIVCYLVVHMIQMKRIRRIPMGRALKDME